MESWDRFIEWLAGTVLGIICWILLCAMTLTFILAIPFYIKLWLDEMKSLGRKMFGDRAEQIRKKKENKP